MTNTSEELYEHPEDKNELTDFQTAIDYLATIGIKVRIQNNVGTISQLRV